MKKTNATQDMKRTQSDDMSATEKSAAIKQVIACWQKLGERDAQSSSDASSRVQMLRAVLLDMVALGMAHARGRLSGTLASTWLAWCDGKSACGLSELLTQAEACRDEPSAFRVAPSFPLDHGMEAVLRACAGELAGQNLPNAFLGDVYQLLQETPFHPSEAAGAMRQHRNRQGCFYTPAEAIAHLLEMVFEPASHQPNNHAHSRVSVNNDICNHDRRSVAMAEKRICDPAMGCGHILLAIAEHLVAGGLSPEVALTMLHGVDVDTEAVRLGRVTLWLAYGVKVPDHFHAGDTLTGSGWRSDSLFAYGDGLNWGMAFPEVAQAGGFDAILANPPFDVLTAFAAHPERKAYASQLRASGEFEYAMHGQLNLYRLFLERMVRLVRPGGRYAVVLPASFLTDEAAMPLRTWVMNMHHLDHIVHFPESAHVFEGVGQAIALVGGACDGGAALAIRMTCPGAEPIMLARSVLERLDAEALPIPPEAARWADVLAWMEGLELDRFDALADGFVGEADQTVYKKYFRDDAGEVLVRGTHVSPFAVDVAPVAGVARFLDAEGFRAAHGAQSPGVGRAACERVVQLGIRNMETRPRLVAGVLPAGIWCGNSVNVWIPKKGVPVELVAALLNSALFDWRFRLTSSNNNINVYEVRSLPVPQIVTAYYAASVRSHKRSAAVGKMLKQVVAAYRGCVRAPESTSWRFRLDEAVFDLFACPEAFRKRITNDAWGFA